MNTLLTIDNGNSRPSVGTFNPGGGLIRVRPLSSFLSSCDDIRRHKIVLADVGSRIPQIEGHPRVLTVRNLRNKSSFLGMPVHYSHTLGDDRLACAWQVFRKKAGRSLLIDSGTFITIDLVDENGFQGGHILPGIQIFLDSYGTGAALPKLEEAFPVNAGNPRTIPRNTPEAILASCQPYLKGTLKEILSGLPPSPRLYLTGGGSSRLIPILKDILPPDTCLVHKPHLIHEALYEIYMFEQ